MSNAFDTSGGSPNLGDLASNFFSTIGNMFSGAGSQPIASPVTAANTSSVDESVIDPATAAQAAITSGQNAPTQTQGQGQRTNQQQSANQQAQNPVAQILRALAQHGQQQMQGNPYQTGGPNVPAANAQEVAMKNPYPEGDSNQSEYGYEIPGLRPRQYPYPYEGESNDQEYGPPPGQGRTPYPEGPSFDQEYGPGRPTLALPPPGGPTGAGQVVPRGSTLPASGAGPGDWIGPFIAGAGRRFGMGPAFSTLAQILQSTPTQAATGVEAPRTLGRSPSGPQPPAPGNQGPELVGKGEEGATTTAPETGKPIETVDPKSKKPVDPKTGDPLPTKKDETPPDEPEVPSGEGPILRDVRGGQSVAPLLGQLAQIALPLIMMGLMGGGRGRHRFVGAHFGHPGGFGGRNYWPYRHGYHSGGGWVPIPIPIGGGGGPQGPQQGGQPGESDLPPHDPYYDKGSRYANPGTPSSTVEGKGPDGQALPYTGEQAASFTDDVANGLGMDPKIARQILAGESSYGQNYTNNREIDGIPSYGPFQLHDSGPGSVGYAFKQATGEDPRDPSTWKDQIVFALKWAQAHGWAAWGAARDHGIPHWAGINRKSSKQFAWNYGQPNGGVTVTGGVQEPNPDGNTPKTTQMGSEGVAPVM